MKLLVLGATGGTGLAMVREAIERISLKQQTEARRT